MKSLNTLLYSVLCIAILNGCSSKSPEALFLERITSQVILPGYQQLSDASQLLAATVDNSCRQQVDTPAMQQHWRNSMLAWQAIQAIKFGPINDNNTSWELQFWPDKKNLIGKKMRPLLSMTENLDADRLRTASVVVRGVPGLEYLLFDETSNRPELQPQRCQLLSLIAHHQATITAQLNAQWRDQYQQRLLNPAADNPDFPNAEQGIAAIVDSYVGQLDQMRDRKLALALGLKSRKPRLNGYLLESWRSLHSRENLQANVGSFQRLMNEGGFTEYLLARQQAPLAKRINAQLSQIAELLKSESTPLFDQFGQGQANNARAIQKQFDQLHQLFKVELPGALNIQLGFNSNDGD